MTYKEKAEEALRQLPDGEEFERRLDLPQGPYYDTFLNCALQIYLQEIPRIPPEPPPNTVEHARWRDKLIAIASNPPDWKWMATALSVEFRRFIEKLPSFPKGKMDVPVFDIVNPRDYFPSLLSAFVSVCPHLFPVLAGELQRRLDDKHIKDSYALLKGTPLEDLYLLAASIGVPDETRFSGTWIVAPPGRGKTTLLHSLFLEDLKKEASIVLIDSKGELIEPIKRLACIKDRLVIIEPDMPLALNPFSKGLHTIELLEYLFSSLLAAAMTPLQSTLFRSCLRAALCYPNPTIQNLPQDYEGRSRPFTVTR